VSVRPRRRSPSERRRFARVAEELVVGCTPRSTGSISATTLNFSAGGVLFCAPRPLSAGQDVDVTLRLPGQREELSFAARVVRVRTLSDHVHEIAAEFATGDAEAQRQLLDFIEERAAPELEPLPPISA
jgi:c-di-GMP-binding flagellar brake protein YcgR